MFDKGEALRELGKPIEAVSAWEEVVRRFGKRTESGLAEPIARSLVNEGIIQNELKHHEEAVIASDAGN